MKKIILSFLSLGFGLLVGFVLLSPGPKPAYSQAFFDNKINPAVNSSPEKVIRYGLANGFSVSANPTSSTSAIILRKRLLFPAKGTEKIAVRFLDNGVLVQGNATTDKLSDILDVDVQSVGTESVD